MSVSYPCPCCGQTATTVLHKVADAPVHSVTLLRHPDEARAVPTRPIQLVLCHRCGFIFNAAFDAAPQDYSRDYVSTQAHSPTFDSFHRRLAEDLVDRWNLRGRTVVEIGGGQGEFLRQICLLGGNRGIGFDPAYEGPEHPTTSLRMVKDYYGEAHADVAADFFICKMTLEHIARPAEFMATVRRAVGDDPKRVVFFQVPDVTRILDERAFWDVYYEHCNYFGATSLRVLFEQAGFEVIGTRVDYDGQYLMIEARPGRRAVSAPSVGALAAKAASFSVGLPDLLARWRRDLARSRAAGEKTVLWGGGSKAVAFLTTLGIGVEVAGAVDINPEKHGTFLAGTAHPVLAPEDLKRLLPHRVIVMNPIYVQEIGRLVTALGVSTDIVPVTWVPSNQSKAVGLW